METNTPHTTTMNNRIQQILCVCSKHVEVHAKLKVPGNCPMCVLSETLGLWGAAWTQLSLDCEDSPSLFLECRGIAQIVSQEISGNL